MNRAIITSIMIISSCSISLAQRAGFGQNGAMSVYMEDYNWGTTRQKADAIDNALKAQIKYRDDYNSEIQRTNHYYGAKNNEAAWRTSDQSLQEMHERLSRSTVDLDINDLFPTPTTANAKKKSNYTSRLKRTSGKPQVSSADIYFRNSQKEILIKAGKRRIIKDIPTVGNKLISAVGNKAKGEAESYVKASMERMPSGNYLLHAYETFKKSLDIGNTEVKISQNLLSAVKVAIDTENPEVLDEALYKTYKMTNGLSAKILGHSKIPTSEEDAVNQLIDNVENKSFKEIADRFWTCFWNNDWSSCNSIDFLE